MGTQQKKSWLCHSRFHSFLALMAVILLTTTTAQASRINVCKGRVYIVPSKREVCRAAATSVTVAPGLRVIDANGETVGYADSLVGMNRRGYVFNPMLNAFVGVDIRDGAHIYPSAGGRLLFTTPDCTGQPYVSGGNENPWVLYNVGGLSYTAVGRNNPVWISPQSLKDPDECMPYPTDTAGAERVQPVMQIELPSFVPPFSLAIQ